MVADDEAFVQMQRCWSELDVFITRSIDGGAVASRTEDAYYCFRGGEGEGDFWLVMGFDSNSM